MLWKTIILFTFFVICSNGYRTRPCDLVNFDYRNFEKDYILNGGLSRPFELTYNAKTKTLLFHEDTDVFQITNTYLIDLNTNKITKIALEHGVDSVVDDDGNFIIATNNGLYTYNPSTKNLSPSDIIPRKSIYNIYKYNGKLYYSDYPQKDLYVVGENGPQLVFGGKNIESFALDSAGNFYYGNSTGIFYGNMRIDSVDFVTQSKDVPFDGLAINPGNEIAFVYSHYGVFKIVRDSGILKRISTKGMLNLVFDDKGSAIYSDEEHIVRLKITNKSCD